MTLRRPAWTTLAWHEAHCSEAGLSSSFFCFAACGAWHERHPAPALTGLCGTVILRACALWQRAQRSLPAALANRGASAACGS